MEIQEKNILAAYKAADENGKSILKALFPAVSFDEEVDNRPVTERRKTLEDAIAELGEDNPYVAQYRCIVSSFSDAPATAAIMAYAKLQVVCAALNEGWEPQFEDEEDRWYPWFWLYTQDEIDRMDKSRRWMTTGDYKTTYAGFVVAYSNYAPSSMYSHIGSRLCFKNSELATYCGKQFMELWVDFHLIRK